MAGALTPSAKSTPVPTSTTSTARCGLEGRAVSLREAMQVIATDLSRLDGRPVPDTLVAKGGAVINMAAVRHQLASYDLEVVQGTVLDLLLLRAALQFLKARLDAGLPVG